MSTEDKDVVVTCNPGMPQAPAPVQDKILIAYHAHCIDGFTSAWACWMGLVHKYRVPADSIELLAMKYGALDTVQARVELYEAIYFVDFSVPVDVLTELCTKTAVTVIDHHKSAIEMYEVGGEEDDLAYVSCGAELILNMAECGASLTWNHFFPDSELPNLIKVVRDYDLWQFKLRHTKELNKYLRLREQTISSWNAMRAMFDSPRDLNAAAGVGRAMLDYHDSIVAQLVEQREPCELNGAVGYVVNCSPQFSSDVGHALAILSGTYGATWQQEPQGKVKWSLRSVGGYDVTPIAKAFGGGGHRNAAGFTLQTPKEDVSRMGITLWAE